MAVFSYKAVEQNGTQREGTVDAVTMDLALSALQRRGLVVSSIVPVQEGGGP